MGLFAMTQLFPARMPSHPLAGLPLLALAAALAGCGGGSDDPPPQDLALLAGDWQSQGCNVVSSSLSERSLSRVVHQDATLFTQYHGAVSYANGDCTGQGTVRLLSPDTANRYAARRTAATASLVVFWGYGPTDPADSPPQGRWVLTGDLLCPAFYATLAIYPPPPPPEPHTYYDLALLARHTEEMRAMKACYTRLPGQGQGL